MGSIVEGEEWAAVGRHAAILTYRAVHTVTSIKRRDCMYVPDAEEAQSLALTGAMLCFGMSSYKFLARILSQHHGCIGQPLCVTCSKVKSKLVIKVRMACEPKQSSTPISTRLVVTKHVIFVKYRDFGTQLSALYCCMTCVWKLCSWGIFGTIGLFERTDATAR